MLNRDFLKCSPSPVALQSAARHPGSCSDQAVRNLGCLSNLLRNLGAKNLSLFNRRRHGEEIWSLGHQCLRNGPAEVSLPSRLIVKRIHYDERGWAQSQRESQ